MATNFYSSSPGLGKSQKFKNQQQPEPNLNDLPKKLEDPLNQSAQPGSGLIRNESQPQDFPQGQSLINPGQQPPAVPIMSEADRQKLLEQDISKVLSVFKGFEFEEEEQDKKQKEVEDKPKESNINEEKEGVEANEVLMFLRFSRPQLDKEHQEILTDFLHNIGNNMAGRQKISVKDFQYVMDNITLRESEKSLNTKEMATLFGQLDRRKIGSFRYEDLMDFYKDKFPDMKKGSKKTSKEEYRKLLEFISRNGEIKYEDFYNILTNEKFMNF